MSRTTWKSWASGVLTLTGMLVAAAATGVAAAAETGVTDDGGAPAQWARWQGRLSLGLTAPGGRADFGRSDGAGLQVGSFSLLGDYYFNGAMRSTRYAGGFRATSGVIVGPRSSPLWSGRASLTSSRGLLGLESRVLNAMPAPAMLPETAPEISAVPYLGVGYTGLALSSRWSFSADLGMVARNPGQAVKLGRVLSGSQGVDELLRELRLAPVIQLGVSYSF